MVTATEILEHCQQQGIVLALASDGGLDLTPEAAVTVELRSDIQANFRALVEALRLAGMYWTPRVQATRMQVMEVETQTQTAEDLIARCTSAGIQLSAHGDKLQISRSRRTQLPAELREALAANKPAILAALAADESDAQQNNAARKPLSLHWMDT